MSDDVPPEGSQVLLESPGFWLVEGHEDGLPMNTLCSWNPPLAQETCRLLPLQLVRTRGHMESESQKA